MPRDQISEKLVSSGQVDLFDALKMETGEWGRLCVVSDAVWWAYVHSMRAPVLDDEDMPVMEDKKRRDGSSAGTGYFMGFVGQRICLGDPAVIEDKKMDPARCPACASAARGTAGMTPERRFAVPLIRYKCKKRNGTDLPATPNGEVLVWKMNQKMYNELVKGNKTAIRELLEIPEGKEFPLRVADVVVQCENGDFSRVVFKPPMRPAWNDPREPERSARYAAWVKEVKNDESLWPTDEQLQAACGRDGDREYMNRDVMSVEDRWRKAERAGKDGTRRPDTADGPVSGGQGQPDLDKTLDDLLEEHPGGLGEFAGAEPAAPVVDDPFAEDAPAAAPAAAPATDPFADDAALVPAAAPATAGSNGNAKVQSFDDILGD